MWLTGTLLLRQTGQSGLRTEFWRATALKQELTALTPKIDHAISRNQSNSELPLHRQWLSKKGLAVRRMPLSLVFFLVLSVQCAEIPELATLTDNTSNDFVSVTCVGTSATTPSAEAQVLPNKRLTESVTTRQAFQFLLVVRPSPIHGRDLLRMISLHRE
jgi:hypothetical protein